MECGTGLHERRVRQGHGEESDCPGDFPAGIERVRGFGLAKSQVSFSNSSMRFVLEIRVEWIHSGVRLVVE